MITLLVTHNLDDAVRLGDRLFFLTERPAKIAHVETIRVRRIARSEVVIADIKAGLLRLNPGNM